MLRKSLLLFTALIISNLIVAPIGNVHASNLQASMDGYEPDNTATQAKPIVSGAIQTHSIHVENDVDWVRFQLATESAIVLETSGPLNSDTRIRLYRGNGTVNPTAVEFNDDTGVGFYSFIDRLCGVDALPAGIYYVRVEEYGDDDRTTIASYNLLFQSSPCPSEAVDILIGGEKRSSSLLSLSGSTRRSFLGLNSGPIKIDNADGSSLIAAERVIYKVNGQNTSFSEMMALPASQLDVTYWLPWYNNVELDTQLRIANVSNGPASVRVFIGLQEMPGSPYSLPVGASLRRSFAGINNGPVRIVSTQNIVAAERVIYKVNGVNTSFSEMMALPAAQLDMVYWLPWYNNVELDTQLRVANVSDVPASVQVFIGGQEMPGSPFQLPAGGSLRRSFVGVNNGPVQIISDQNIVAAERVIYKANGVNTSFTEMMALPATQLDTTYWLPWYNNVELDTQLRFANVSNTPASVQVFIGGQEMPGSPFNLPVGGSLRKSFVGVNQGPVRIVSDQNIVAAERVIYRVNNIPVSFSEMMALPNSQLDTVYWLPWYNNVELDTQLRIGLP